MRQVPCYGIVGDGRLASHFAHYLKSKGHKIKQWSRRMGAEFCECISDRLADCDVILVLISDDQVVPFIETHSSFFAGKTVVHASGRLSTPLARGAHPMMTFGPHLYDLETYENTLFAVEGEVEWFQKTFPGLENPLVAIRSEDKDLYHSLCVLSGNFTTMLWQKFFSEMQERFKIPAHYCAPFLQQVARNLSVSPEGALTGPIARGDHQTIEADLRALAGDPFQRVFKSFIDWKSPSHRIDQSVATGAGSTPGLKSGVSRTSSRKTRTTAKKASL